MESNIKEVKEIVEKVDEDLSKNFQKDMKVGRSEKIKKLKIKNVKLKKLKLKIKEVLKNKTWKIVKRK
jgi:hypothetical protein